MMTASSYAATVSMRRSNVRTPLISALSTVLFTASVAFAGPVSRVATAIVGDSFVHEVQEGETLTSLAARYGVDAAVLARRNKRPPRAALTIGDQLAIDNRHIVWPVESAAGTTLVINLPQRMLFRFVDGQMDAAFPVAVGRPTWQTPRGPFTVLEKEVDPTWDVPASIQDEMRREGKPVITSIPPCPENPLGRYWIRLSHSGVGLHGTNAPTSIYRFTTHGCIRLHPDDVANLFQRVQIGDRGVTVYDPILLARTANGRVFVEVQPDPYRQGTDPLRYLQRLAGEAGITAEIDWHRVHEVVRLREGLAVDVTRDSLPGSSGGG